MPTLFKCLATSPSWPGAWRRAARKCEGAQNPHTRDRLRKRPSRRSTTQRTPQKTALAAQVRPGGAGKPKIGRSRTRAADFLVPAAGIEPARCCHRGILSPLRLPVSPRRHICAIVPPAARSCQGQEARRAAAKNRPRRRQITNTRLLHLHGYFDRIINYCIIIIDRFGFEAHSAYEIP